MKNYLCFVFAILFCCNVGIGQTVTSSISQSKERTTKKITNSELKQKLELRIDNDSFNLKFNFDKNQTEAVHNILTTVFGTEGQSKNTREWTLNDSNCSIHSTRGKLRMKMNKEAMSNLEYSNVQEGIEEIFAHLGWESSELGLWNFSGSWNINLD